MNPSTTTVAVETRTLQKRLLTAFYLVWFGVCSLYVWYYLVGF